MNPGKFTLSLDGRARWGVFVFMVLVQVGMLLYVGWRWHNIGVDGIPYQWQCVPRVAQSSFGTDYIDVSFPEDTTQWLDAEYPVPGQDVYVRIARDDKGMIQIKGAASHKPPQGEDYMKAKVVSFQYGTVKFTVGFDRYRMNPQLADGIYDIAAGDSVIASIRMKKGEGVIEGIFVNGMPLELCSSQTMAEGQHNKGSVDPGKASDRSGIVEAGMVPPKEER